MGPWTVPVMVGMVVMIVLAVFVYEYLQADDQPAGVSPVAATRARYTVAAIVLAVSFAALMYRGLMAHSLGQSAALFVGIPTVLALAAVFAPTGSSATSVAVKSVTIGLMIALLFLEEGMLCVLMSAPLFYLVAVMLGAAVDDSKPSHRSRIFSWIGVFAVVPMSLEGVTPLTTIDRSVTVSRTQVVAASATEVSAAIDAAPRFDRALPGYLSIGFPRPIASRIENGRWIVRMRGGEMRLNGMEPRAGDLVLERDGKGAGYASWRAVSDDSHMTHFLNWETSRVEWRAIDRHTTLVTWTLGYRRGLDPAWYFGPMERYAVGLAAGYLIDSVATP